MFPLPWNFPFRKKDGTVVNVEDAISGGGGSDLPDYDSSDAGKILGVDENGYLEWSDAVEDLSADVSSLDSRTDVLELHSERVDDEILIVGGSTIENWQGSGVNIISSLIKDTTLQGIVFTINDDKTITAVGTSLTSFGPQIGTATLKAGVTYKIFDTINEVVGETDAFIAAMDSNNTILFASVNTEQYPNEYTPESDIDVKIHFVILANVTLDKTFYPSIINTSVDPGGYVVPAKSNLELTSEVQNLDINVKTFEDRADVLGAKNFLRNDAVSTTESGVTFTVRDDGTILVSGTATADVLLTIRDDLYLPDGRYTMSLEPIVPNQYAEIDVTIKSADDSEVLETFKLGNPQLFPSWEIEHTFTYSSSTAGKIIIVLKVWNTTVMQDAVIKPMIRLASDGNMTYQPYSKTNQELTTEVSDITDALNELGDSVTVNGTAQGPITLQDRVHTNLVEMTLNKGDYLFIANVRYLANDVGFRKCSIYDQSEWTGTQFMFPAFSGNVKTTCRNVYFQRITTDGTKMYVIGQQNSGGDLDVDDARLTAVKIGYAN